jgi:hypothetical protein
LLQTRREPETVVAVALLGVDMLGFGVVGYVMVGVFESGSYHSAFPDTCLLKGSMATVPGEDSDAVKQEFVRFSGSPPRI